MMLETIFFGGYFFFQGEEEDGRGRVMLERKDPRRRFWITLSASKYIVCSRSPSSARLLSASSLKISSVCVCVCVCVCMSKGGEKNKKKVHTQTLLQQNGWAR